MAARLTVASGHEEREAALEMLKHRTRRRWRGRITLAADKGYDTRGFVEQLREGGVTPHVAQNTSGRSSAIDGRTTRHSGYAYLRELERYAGTGGHFTFLAELSIVQLRYAHLEDWLEWLDARGVGSQDAQERGRRVPRVPRVARAPRRPSSPPALPGDDRAAALAAHPVRRRAGRGSRSDPRWAPRDLLRARRAARAAR